MISQNPSRSSPSYSWKKGLPISLNRPIPNPISSIPRPHVSVTGRWAYKLFSFLFSMHLIFSQHRAAPPPPMTAFHFRLHFKINNINNSMTSQAQMEKASKAIDPGATDWYTKYPLPCTRKRTFSSTCVTYISPFDPVSPQVLPKLSWR